MSERDPILHQILRPIVTLLIGLGIIAIFAVYFWWDYYREKTSTKIEYYIALLVCGIVSIPWVILMTRISVRLSPKEPPIEGPDVPICPHCGYDLRATPERCPECGKSPDQGHNDKIKT